MNQRGRKRCDKRGERGQDLGQCSLVRSETLEVDGCLGLCGVGGEVTKWHREIEEQGKLIARFEEEKGG